jgi:hypothetical protein
MKWRDHRLLKFGGGMSAVEYRAIASTLENRAPCNLLVFGTGYDSDLWLSINSAGRTQFIEDDPLWKHMGGDSVVMVEYGTTLEDWPRLLDDEAALLLELPPSIANTAWDVILVDGPAAFQSHHPGRMKSIFTASWLASRHRKVDVFVHDCDRLVEQIYCDTFLCSENLVDEVGKLRHYAISR